MYENNTFSTTNDISWRTVLLVVSVPFAKNSKSSAKQNIQAMFQNKTPKTSLPFLTKSALNHYPLHKEIHTMIILSTSSCQQNLLLLWQREYKSFAEVVFPYDNKIRYGNNITMTKLCC